MPTIIKDNTVFEEAIKSSTLSVIHFQADWAAQCEQVNEALEALSKQHENVTFYSCPAEELNELSLKYNIEAVPTVLFFKSGKKIDQVNGADVVKLTETVKSHSDQSDKTEPLEARLKSLINQSKVMLFMKGDRVTPRCGFSRQIIEILNNIGVTYKTFDILQDEEVRQGLKTYSDWPTYPQLYANGELIGGLDIVKEMLATGDLQASLSS